MTPMTPESNAYPQDENLTKLAQLALGVFRLSSPERNWMFYGSEHANGKIFNLYQIFSQIRANFSQKTASFLDCGSGNGLAALVASIAGFEKVYGIEKNRPLFLEAQNNLSYCQEKNLLRNSNIYFFNASYYQLVNHHEDVVASCLQELNNFYEQDGIFYSSSFLEYTQALLKEKNRSLKKMVENYLFSPDSNKNLKNSSLLKNGQLTADFVYIYPADLFFSRVFLPQIAKLLKKGAFLGILSPADDKSEIEKDLLQKKEEIKLAAAPASLVLSIFQRVNTCLVCTK